MLGKVDAIVETLKRWSGEVAFLTWGLVSHPRDYWRKLREAVAGSRLTLPPFGTLAFAVLFVDLAIAVTGADFGSPFSQTPKQFLEKIAEQWPFLLHLILVVGSAGLMSSLIVATFSVRPEERSAVNHLAAFPTSLGMVVLGLGLLTDAWWPVFVVFCSLYIVTLVALTSLAGQSMAAALPRALAKLGIVLLGSLLPLLLPLAVLFSSDALRPVPEPWVKVALNQTTVSPEGILTARVQIQSQATETVSIQRENASASLRSLEMGMPIAADYQQILNSPIEIVSWNGVERSPVLSLEPEREAWLQLRVDSALSCRFCIARGFRILFSFSLDELSALPPEQPRTIVDAWFGIPQPAKGDKVLLISCSLMRTGVGDAIPDDSPQRLNAALTYESSCKYVGRAPEPE